MRRTIQIIEEGIASGLHRGMQLWVQRADDTPIDLALGTDHQNAPLSTRHRMLWMSAGKPVTAIAMLQQIDRGKATLATPVAALIPDFAQNGKASITIEHLLTHTAGFRGPLNSFTPGPWETIIQRCCELKLEPNWVPGKKAGYHVASSWFILGELVRLLDGRPIERYVREDVFGRAGAADCSVGIAEADFGPLDVLIEPNFPGNKVVDAMTTPRPPANARGPIRELAVLYQSLLRHDGRLLSPEMSRRMIARQREGLFDETFKQTTDWGFGVKLDSKRYGQPEQYGYGPHASDLTFGHSGNQCACAFADPKHQLVVAWCANGMPGELKHQQRQNRLNGAIYEDLGLA